MTINEIITEAINNPENFNENGFLNWSFVDSDLWLHPEAVNFTDDELTEAVSQIDKSNDGEFSFEELWTWWIQDKL